MPIWIPEATGGTYPLGPFVDGSGIPAGSLNIIRADIFLSKNGGVFGTIAALPTAYASKDGYYHLGLDTTDTNTRGHLKVEVSKSGYLPVWQDFHVVPTQMWPVFFGDGIIPTVGYVGTLGFVRAGIIGSLGHVSSMANPAVPFVGSTGYAGIVGSVAYSALVGSVFHVASMSNPGVPFVGSIGYAGIVGSVAYAALVGSVGHVASMANPVVGFVGSVGMVGSVGHVASMAKPAVDFVGSVGYAGAVGTALHAQTVGTSLFVRDGVIGSLGFVSDGKIGTLGYAMALGSIAAGIIGTISHSISVGTLSGLAAAALNDIADTLLKRDIDQVEASAAIHSLCSAILKAVSRIKDNAGTLETYRTNGTTLHMSQTVTTDPANEPIDELSSGV